MDPEDFCVDVLVFWVGAVESAAFSKGAFNTAFFCDAFAGVVFCVDAVVVFCVDAVVAFCVDAAVVFCVDAAVAFCVDAVVAFCVDAVEVFCVDVVVTFCVDVVVAFCVDAAVAFCADVVVLCVDAPEVAVAFSAVETTVFGMDTAEGGVLAGVTRLGTRSRMRKTVGACVCCAAKVVGAGPKVCGAAGP